MTGRFPSRVFSRGDEPDPRFSLANERTFLAWIRTSLALYAAAFALEALQIGVSEPWRIAAAVVFLILGTTAALQALLGWCATELALRMSKPLPGLSIGAALSVGIVIAAALLTIGLVV